MHLKTKMFILSPLAEIIFSLRCFLTKGGIVTGSVTGVYQGLSEFFMQKKVVGSDQSWNHLVSIVDGHPVVSVGLCSLQHVRLTIINARLCREDL